MTLTDFTLTLTDFTLHFSRCFSKSYNSHMTAISKLKEGYNATYSHICVNYFAENVEGDEAEYDGTERCTYENGYDTTAPTM